MKFSLTVILLIVFAYSSIKAQVTYANPEEFKILKQRTLIVELLELDQKQIDSWEKQREKLKTKKPEDSKRYADMIEEYKMFIDNYNSYIKSAVEKNWDFNENIEYKTTSEVEKIRKNSVKYTILWFSESSTTKVDEHGFRYFPNLTIPTLNYSRIEKGTAKVDYSFFMPYTGHREKNLIKESDLFLSLKLMRNHILEIEKSGKKKYTFQEYTEDQAKLNCKELSGKKLAIYTKDIHPKATFPEIKSAYVKGEIIQFTENDISKAIENEDEIVIGFSIPHRIAVGSAGPLSGARILYHKAFVDVEDGTIYTCYGTRTGEFNDPYFRVKEFQKHSNCE